MAIGWLQNLWKNMMSIRIKPILEEGSLELFYVERKTYSQGKICLLLIPCWFLVKWSSSFTKINIENFISGYQVDGWRMCKCPHKFFSNIFITLESLTVETTRFGAQLSALVWNAQNKMLVVLTSEVSNLLSMKFYPSPFFRELMVL